MKRHGSSGVFRPFEDLATLIRAKSVSLSDRPSAPPKSDGPESSRQRPGANRERGKPGNRTRSVEPDHPVAESDPEEERRTFMEAMANVKPVMHNRWSRSQARLRVAENHGNDTDEALSQLRNLVENGEGFVVANTPEYMEGIGHNINPTVARRLHRGDYSIQAHIDLHGLGVDAAKHAFEKFLKESLMANRRSLLIVHGRGLSSPRKPVLKTEVFGWLTRGPWSKWVVAFTSARLLDGGAGATYVLLRQRPLTKRFIKKNRKMT